MKLCPGAQIHVAFEVIMDEEKKYFYLLDCDLMF